MFIYKLCISLNLKLKFIKFIAEVSVYEKMKQDQQVVKIVLMAALLETTKVSLLRIGGLEVYAHAQFLLSFIFLYY